MDVLLYRVGRNLNRAYRTCEAFGVQTLKLLECSGQLHGNLFKAKDHVRILHISSFETESSLALETFYLNSIYNVDWENIKTIVVGGETSNLPYPNHVKFAQQVKIPMIGNISGLTVEAALAIALYEWRKNDPYKKT